MKTYLIGCILASVAACTTPEVPYEDDSTFLVAAQAASPEFLTYVNGMVCRDINNAIGLCALKVKHLQDLEFRTEPQQYGHRVHLVCSENVLGDKSFDVAKGGAWAFVLDHDAFKAAKSFLCIGEVFPADRPEAVSARFEVRFRVVDEHYVERERLDVRRDGEELVVVLGKNALYGRVCLHPGSGDHEECHDYQKEAVVRLRDASTPAEVSAWSESRNMRFNYWFGGI